MGLVVLRAQLSHAGPGDPDNQHSDVPHTVLTTSLCGGFINPLLQRHRLRHGEAVKFAQGLTAAKRWGQDSNVVRLQGPRLRTTLHIISALMR